MRIKTRYVFFASMDVDPGYEELFNEVYDKEHIPSLLRVPGVLSVTRLKGEPFSIAIGGEQKEMPMPSPRYTAIYEIDDPKVLNSDAWAKAVEEGRWPTEVRPHTHQRQHGLYQLM